MEKGGGTTQENTFEQNNKLLLSETEQKNTAKVSEADILSLDEVVLCGAGYNGVKLCNRLLRQRYRGIKGFCDNFIGDLDKNKSGMEVFSFETAAEKFPRAYFVITVENSSIVSEMTVRLLENGINGSRIKVYEKGVVPPRKFVRGKQPIWCPAGMMSLHVDPDGDAYPCMVAINNKKMFGTDTMPLYKVLGNILEEPNMILSKQPQMCWESFRCSACDYGPMEQGMTNLELENTNIFFPLPE